jgi:hypothetical protein
LAFVRTLLEVEERRRKKREECGKGRGKRKKMTGKKEARMR